MAENIAIVGAGVGGLASAARLASRGYHVEVFERLSECGGRCHLLADRGFKFDMGPSFILMPDFFAEVFSYCGRNLADYLDLQVLDPSYKIYYPDGRSLTVYRDSEKTKEELEKFEPGSALNFQRFIQEVTRIYKITRPLLYQCFTPLTLLDPRYWRLVTQLNLNQTYWQLARKFFKTKELCYAFTFEAMFIGVSPFAAPAFYSVISYTDHVQKIFHPMGGMYQIPLSLEALAKQLGVRFHYNSEVRGIRKKGNHIHLALGSDDCLFDKAIVNADYAYTKSQLLGRPIPRYKYSCSVYLMYLGLKKKVEGLAHHNLFFSSDLRRNLKQIFQDKTMPDDPSFYIHVPTVTDPSLAPPGKDLFYILVPVPNLERPRQDFLEYEEKLRRTVFTRIKKVLGIHLENLVELEHKFYPYDFISRYNIKYGATFGLAHNLMQSAFFRPANYDAKIKDLYFVGASTQPGGGLPVVIAGSRIVADLIERRA